MHTSDPKTWRAPLWHSDFGNPQVELDHLRSLALKLAARDPKLEFRLETPEPGYMYLHVLNESGSIAEAFWHDDETRFGLFVFTIQGEVESYPTNESDATEFILSQLPELAKSAVNVS